MTSLPNPPAAGRLRVGGSAQDITPTRPCFLYGYPHVPRMSSGVSDPLLASAICLDDGERAAILVSADVIWLSKQLVAEARRRISQLTSLPPHAILISASHTHSGPVTVSMVSNADDPVVPPPDAAYLDRLVDGISEAAIQAWQRRQPAELALLTIACAGIGGNRLDPAGPTIEHIPIAVARSTQNPTNYLGLLYVNRVHPTVLHEDSKHISGDFPGFCRRYLQNHLLGDACPVLCPLGAAGDQSPRHVAREHTLAEAERLGNLLGEAIATSLASARFSTAHRVHACSREIDLPPRAMPSINDAERQLQIASQRHDELQRLGAPAAKVRTAECAVFGAQETRTLARAATTDSLKAVYESCLPAEIQVITIGSWRFAAWPGEVFAEFALQVRREHPNAHVITLANGELQGYLVTEQAVRAQCYEASNALFSSPAAPRALVTATLELLSTPAD